ncbi:MAG: CHASE2 domain-containing protein [Verrucomicrobiota bacterium]
MKLKAIKIVPSLIAISVVLLMCFAQALPRLFPDPEHPGHSKADFFQRLKWMTYDWRVRAASLFSQQVASDVGMPGLGFVAISDRSIDALLSGELGVQYGLLWPKDVYGKLIRELKTQGAIAVGIDVIFGELRPDHDKFECKLPDGELLTPDGFFAHYLREAGNVILAASGDQMPPDLFRTNAWTMGDAEAEKDSDGVLRRVKAFQQYPKEWHPAIMERVELLKLDLSAASIGKTRIVIPSTDPTIGDFEVLLKADGSMDMEDLTGEPSPTPQFPFREPRIWNLGIALAAYALKLDLENPEIHPREIILRGPNGVQRTIQTDEHGYFYIDWSIGPKDPKLEAELFEDILRLDYLREKGELDAVIAKARELGENSIQTNRWAGKLVVVGSNATGNNLTDRGATPLAKDSFLVSRYWNIANTILLNRFLQPASNRLEILLIVLLGFLAAMITWELRVNLASLTILLVLVAYVCLSFYLFISIRYWLPLVFPVLAIVLNYIGLVTYRAIFEQQERRHVKQVFSKLVSPDVVNELLSAETLSLGGMRRNLTVFFADVRGFTEFTDVSHANAVEYVRRHNLIGKEAEAHFDKVAAETLSTVNLYLSAISDTILKHKGTLDKYIGDCVMAFWGAPGSNEKHAAYCVRCAIDAQRAIYALNQERAAENKRREQENAQRVAKNEEPLPMLPLLTLGSGINTGPMTVGMMGSMRNIINYTVFGLEVNMASRLEGVSGRGRIIISDNTFLELKKHDPELAATCVALPATTVKGIKQAIKIYEVPWKIAAPATAQPAAPASSTETAKTAAAPAATPTTIEPVKA